MPTPRAAVFASPGRSRVALGSLSVGSPVGTVPLRTFREVLYLRFAAGGLAEGIALAPAATVLRARFGPRDYEALHPGAPLSPAAVRVLDGALVVELDAPRRLLSVRLVEGKVPAGSTLRVHRLDGQALAEKPTATASAAPGGIFSFDFTDARFALRLQGPAGPVSLVAADVLAVQVRADPAGARIGIAAPDSLAAPALVWPDSGDAAPAVEVNAGKALAEALERHLAALPAPLPDTVDVALVIAADAPCRLDLLALEVPYRLVRLSFGSGFKSGPNAGPSKEVLRFAGTGAADRSLLLQLPGGATVVEAKLDTLPSLRGVRPVPGASGATAAEPVEQTGVRVDGRAWVAQRLTPPQAVAVRGIAVGLLGLTPGAKLTLELREDHQGEPTGRTLAEGSLPLDQAGRRLWSTVFLSAPVILPAQPCWLLLTAAAGEAVWLARSGEATVRVLGRPEAPAARRADIEGLETLHRLLVVEASQTGIPALELRLGDMAVAETTGGEGDRKSFDLAAALTRHLAGRSASSPQDIPLAFSSAVPGSLTVYPPRITYEPPG
jgi:hypothetical protein